MARVKRGVTARARHKKILSRAKGYYNARRKVFRVAKQAVTKALQYAYIGRKQKKRQFRALWIVRINAAARMYGLSYSRLMNGLKKPRSRSTARCWPTSPCTTSRRLAPSPKKRKPASRRDVQPASVIAGKNHVGSGRCLAPHVRFQPSGFVELCNMDTLGSQVEQALGQIASAASLDALDGLRVSLLGKTGLVTEQLKQLGKLPTDERKVQGERVNRAKEQLQQAIAARKATLEDSAFDKRLSEERVDITLPGRDADLGGFHPVTRTLDRIVEIFSALGYQQAKVPRSKTTTTISRH